MTKKKQQLIANAFEEVKKNLSISDSNPKERLNKFQKKLDATEPNVIFRLKAVWQVLIALMVSFYHRLHDGKIEPNIWCCYTIRRIR